ncbi:MAG: T9SS type A sorting domain-containing protein [Ignavibacteriaceae bacterium]|nr:T9SS type A sorting domain-containing protein [Ignavibacteriaceae bacterium]
MLKNLFTFMILALFAIQVTSFAQNAKVVSKKAPIISAERNATPVVRESSGPAPVVPTAANWVAVDTMQNAYGPAIGVLNPMAFDPGSGALALVHRGRNTYAAGSGTLWYNMSTDNGVTWSRVGQVNVGVPINARYPSMAISNPTNGPLSGTTGIFSWPELVGGAFGGLGYAAEQPLGANAPAAFINSGTQAFSSQVLTWASDNTPYVYWSSDNSTDAAYTIWRTQDFATIDSFAFPSTAFEDGGNICLGASAGGGQMYIAFLGTLPDPAGANPITSGWYPGVAKKSATGADWDAIEVVDFRTIPGLTKFDRLYDFKKGDEFVSYDGDIIVDKDGYPHLLLGLTDTTTSNNSGSNAIVEIYKTAAGWAGKIVFEGISDSIFGRYGLATPGIGQMGPSPYLARSADGNAFVAVWANGTSTTDTICDIFMSVRSASGEWSTPTNLTQTPAMNEDGLHLASYVAGSAGQYTAFVWSHYEAGNTGHPIVDTNPSVIYVAAVPFNVTVGVEDETSPVSFTLNQNYPNPFNPATTISYNLSGRANVSLKVFDMLGREVASLVNGVKEAGNHTVSFDASNLTSGLYVYRLDAGSQTATRKMMLVK